VLCAPVLAATVDAGKASVVTHNGWLAFLKKNRLSGAALPIKGGAGTGMVGENGGGLGD
jgi:hypothetical protein